MHIWGETEGLKRADSVDDFSQPTDVAAAGKLLVCEALSYKCMRPYATSVRGLKVLVLVCEAVSY
jgi:hypothetical protein